MRRRLNVGLRGSFIVAYDFEAAAEAVRRTDCPQRDDLAGGIVRPPTTEEAITVMERRAGRTYPR